MCAARLHRLEKTVTAINTATPHKGITKIPGSIYLKEIDYNENPAPNQKKILTL
jgi:hypothetical protein